MLFRSLNILQTDSGKVNISAPTVNLSTTDGFKVTGSIYNSSLTNNRVVIGGVDGLLEDDANFTFDASVLKLGQGKFEVDVADGDIRTSGSLLVKNTGTVSGSLSVDGHINLTNEAQIRVTDNTTNTTDSFISTIDVSGAPVSIGKREQQFRTGDGASNRSSTIFPIAGAYNNSALTPVVFKITLTRNNGNDTIQFYNSSYDACMKITEIAL